jgi:hypothetical protein
MKMKRKSLGMLMLALALMAASIGLIGCATPPVSGGEAIDAVGVSKVREIQFYAGATFELILMRTKNNQPDTTAVVKRGVPSYTREKIIIPYNTPCVVVRQETAEDGRLILTVAFEKDENLLLSFIQSSNELGYYTTFDLLFEGDSDVPVVQYGNAFYTVRSYNVIRGAYGIPVGEARARPFLGIRETVKDKVIRTAAGRKL